MIGQVTIYCETMFWQRATYTLISSYTTIESADPMGEYTHVLSSWRSGTMKATHWISRRRKLTRAFSIREAPPTYTNQTKTPLAPPSHKIYHLYSYPTPISPKYSPFVPTLTATPVDSAPPPANCCQKTKQWVPITWTEVLSSLGSHMLIKPSPYIPLSPQQPPSFDSSPSRSDTSLKLDAPDWVPPVVQTCHTGGTRVGVDSPPPGLLCCPEGVSEQSAPRVFSVRTLSFGIPPQGTSTGQWWQ